MERIGSFRVLDAAVPEERSLWHELLRSWPGREVMADPGYVQLFAREEDRVLCAAATSAGGGILFPFILRPLGAELWSSVAERSCDIVTPYGYGGAFAWNTEPGAGDQFWDAFDAWAVQSGVVSAFARLSLFADERLAFRGGEEDALPNVVRSLELPTADVWADYAHKVRKNVAKARRSGLEARFDSTAEFLDAFLEIYGATMDRREAAPEYHFRRDFFESLVAGLPGQFVFCHVWSQNRIVSTELVLVSADRMYSFLGGTLAEAFDLRPNDLLKHAVVEWGIAHNKRAYVLGGGQHGEDGIFRYKQSFAPQGTVMFRVGKRVYDEQSNQRLIEQRARWEQEQGRAWSPEAAYFPAYRARTSPSVPLVTAGES
jgi:hypothetical protein